MKQPPTDRPNATPARVWIATAAVSVAAAALAFLPLLFVVSYTRDEYECGGLGIIGVGLFGWLLGVLAFCGTVVAVAIALRRARLLLLLAVVPLQFALLTWDPQWPPTMRLCDESLSLLVPALLVALAGGSTYALTRGAGVRPPSAS